MYLINPLIEPILEALRLETDIPKDLWLTKIVLKEDPSAASPPKRRYRFRAQGAYYELTYQFKDPINHQYLCQVTFWEPKGIQGPTDSRTTTPVRYGPNTGDFQFTSPQVATYLQLSQDMNPKHTEANPIVPGLMIASWALDQLKMRRASHLNDALIFRFKSPLKTSDRFTLIKNNHGFTLENPTTIFLDIQLQMQGDYEDEGI